MSVDTSVRPEGATSKTPAASVSFKSLYGRATSAWGRMVSQLPPMPPKARLGFELGAHAAVSVTAIALSVMAGSSFAIFSTLVGAIAMGVLIYKGQTSPAFLSRVNIVDELRATQTNTKLLATICFSALALALVPSIPVRLISFGILGFAANDIAAQFAR